ncbi:MAG: hypothetical protein IH993_04545 [Proteobacteria bacterium]|nr:hypothetical protein [Pseudomonadota bacterium]
MAIDRTGSRRGSTAGMLADVKALIPVFVFALAASSQAQIVADGADPVAALSPCSPNPPGAVLGDGVTTGPEHGTLIAIGGGRLTPEVIGLFIDAAGGINAPIVYVPTAHAGDLSQRDDEAYGIVRTLRARGCTDITVVHTRDRLVADTDAEAEAEALHVVDEGAEADRRQPGRQPDRDGQQRQDHLDVARDAPERGAQVDGRFAGLCHARPHKRGFETPPTRPVSALGKTRMTPMHLRDDLDPDARDRVKSELLRTGAVNARARLNCR